MSKTIEIVILPNGKSRVETKGFVGSECRQASQFVEQALGQRVHEVLTVDFYASTMESQPVQERH